VGSRSDVPGRLEVSFLLDAVHMQKLSCYALVLGLCNFYPYIDLRIVLYISISKMFLIILICNIYCLYLVHRQMLFALFKKTAQIERTLRRSCPFANVLYPKIRGTYV
jgi:hypothetical protein